jgi:hypothetical protein
MMFGNPEELKEQAKAQLLEEGRPLTEENIKMAANDILHTKTAISTILSAAATAAITKDAKLTSTGIATATNVTENNCIPSMAKSMLVEQTSETKPEEFWQDEFDDPRDVYLEMLKKEERVRATQALIDPETYHPVQAAHECTHDEFVQDRLAYDEFRIGKNLSPQARERLTQEYSKSYYILRQWEANKELFCPGHRRLSEMCSLSFEELKAMRMQEMDPNGSFSTKQRSNAEQIIRNEFELLRGKSIDFAIGATLGVAGGKVVYPAFNRARAFAANRNRFQKPSNLRTVDGLDLETAGKPLSKDQPWTIRPGQEWKLKIFGKAQKTGTPGHATRSYREAIKEAKQVDTEKVYLNRGYRGITGEQVSINRRPDKTTVKMDGKVNVLEVKSKTDKDDLLLSRNQETMNQLPQHIQGSIFIKKPTKK